MGLFDTIRFNHPLFGQDRGTEGQTKDLENGLDYYEITPEGRLVRDDYTIEDRSDPSKPGIEGLIGCMTRIPSGKTDINYHGYLSAIALGLNGTADQPYAYDWKCKFTDGNLVSAEKEYCYGRMPPGEKFRKDCKESLDEKTR